MKNPYLHRDYSKERTVYHALDRVLLKRLLSYLYPYRHFLVVSVLVLLLSKMIEAFVPVYLGILAQKMLKAGTHDDQLAASIAYQCLGIMGVLLFSYGLDSLNVYIKSWVGQRAIFTLRSDVYKHIESLPLSYFDRHSVGQLMTRTIHDVDQIDQMFTDSVVPIIGSLFLFICIFIGIAFMSWKVALAIALILPFVVWLTNNFRLNQRRCYETVRAIVSAMNSFVQEYLMGASTIRNFGLQNKERERFEELNEDHCTAYQESIHHFAFFIAGIDFMQNLTLITVFVVLVATATLDTGFQAGTYFTMSLYALMFYRPLADLAERYNVLQSAMAASERVFHVLDLKSEPAGTQMELGPIETIAFEDVWFAYEAENWVLKGVSLHVRRGDSIAIVGMTGSGKTTMMSLLLRLYDYQKGDIKINGRSIRDYSVHSLRTQFSVVLQDPVIFSGTIAENIALYEKTITRPKIDAEIDYINMRSVLERFSGGLDFKLTERGKSLSMGEMQLISMARAVAHERSVLILDEATANIDTKTEKIIQEALKKILKEKTALVIAHRLSTIRDAHSIIVMHHGKIVETGTHQELLSRKGVYEKLYRLQFQDV